MAPAKMDFGDARLTSSEARVLASLLRGNANKDIAQELGCTVKNIEFHVSNILRKTGQPSRAKLIATQHFPEIGAFADSSSVSESRLRLPELSAGVKDG